MLYPNLLLLLLLQLVTDTAQAISEGRGKAQLLHTVAVDRSPSDLRALGVTSITDCFTDPCGWVLQPQPGSSSAAGGASEPDAPSCSVEWQDLKHIQQTLQSGLLSTAGQCSCCLVLAGLSTLLLRHAEMQVCVYVCVCDSAAAEPEVKHTSMLPSAG